MAIPMTRTQNPEQSQEYMSHSIDSLEQEIQQFGAEVFQEVQDAALSVFDSKFYTGKLMNWSMEDEEFKISLFRFIDVLSALDDPKIIMRHVDEYFGPVADRLPSVIRMGLNVSSNSVSAVLAAPMIKKQIRAVAEQFILGETPKTAMKPLHKIRKSGSCFTVDLLGEATVSEEESIIYLNRYLDVLNALEKEASSWKPLSGLENHIGERTPLNISVKLSALYSQAKPVATEQSVEKLAERLAQIFRRAKEVDAFVYVDMEDTPLVSICIDTFKKVCELPEFEGEDRFGIVLQAYLRRTEEDVDELVKWCREKGKKVGVRLVKGAYWDTETILAKQHGWEIPVWQEKASSDQNYERLADKLIENADVIMPAFGSHNIRSLCYAVKTAEAAGLTKDDFEIQVLYGMAVPIKRAFMNRGYLVREYAPIGELIPGMGYLVRRLLENTSNEGFLRQSFREGETPDSLLKKPVVENPDPGTSHIPTDFRKKFANSPFRDFSLKEVRDKLRAEIEKQRAEMMQGPAEIFPIVGGKKITNTDNFAESRCVEDPTYAVAKVGLASVEVAEQAMQSIVSKRDEWRDTPVEERAEVMFRAAEIMESRREELTATICLEVGKQWTEADGDVAEAIDFLNYYGHQAIRLFHKNKMGDLPGEFNQFFYEPKGSVLVISPWNFAIAIPCGMLSAALVTGNTAVLKPAEQSSLIGSKLVEILLEAGLPETAVAFIPGRGREVGPYLADHKEITTTVFTGSKEVGLGLVRRATDDFTRSEHVKRVIAEMGGKNAIIVDDDADLDEAVAGVVKSAFGYQGQKCSACSRAIVLESQYEKFLARLKDATNSLVVGPASNPAVTVGPVIDEKAYTKIAEFVEEAKKDCTLVAEGAEPLPGSPESTYIRPTVFADIPDGHPILHTELFGPVLAVVSAKDFDEALEKALDSEFGLTGAVFSRSPKNIEKARDAFRVGNLYINTGSTGALVYRQPFGGSKMSGVGSKAGGPDYLLQFVIPRTVSENTMRRGFAPDL